MRYSGEEDAPKEIPFNIGMNEYQKLLMGPMFLWQLRICLGLWAYLNLQVKQKKFTAKI